MIDQLTPISSLDEIKLGMLVEDIPSGTKGTVVSRCNSLSGMTQFGVQPKGDGEKLPDAFRFDWHTLTIIDPVHLTANVAAPQKVLIDLGAKVKDTVSGVEGVVTDIQIFINGCVYIDLTGLKNRDGEAITQRFAQSRLVVKKPPANPVEPKKPGGPPRKL